MAGRLVVLLLIIVRLEGVFKPLVDFLFHSLLTRLTVLAFRRTRSLASVRGLGYLVTNLPSNMLQE